MFNFEIIILFLLPPTSRRRRRRRDHRHHRRDYHRHGCRHSFRRRGCTRSRRPCSCRLCCCLLEHNSRRDRLRHCRRHPHVNLHQKERCDCQPCWHRRPRRHASPASCSVLKHSHHPHRPVFQHRRHPQAFRHHR